MYFLYAYHHSTEGQRPETVQVERQRNIPAVPAKVSVRTVQKKSEIEHLGFETDEWGPDISPHQQQTYSIQPKVDSQFGNY